MRIYVKEGGVNEYFVAYEPDLRCYPNYSFEIGDLNGDGRMEMVSLNQNGNRLRVVSLVGEVLLERRAINHGNWGTPLPCVTDLDSDASACSRTTCLNIAMRAGIRPRRCKNSWRFSIPSEVPTRSYQPL